jgi:hypothetical protein
MMRLCLVVVTTLIALLGHARADESPTIVFPGPCLSTSPSSPLVGVGTIGAQQMIDARTTTTETITAVSGGSYGDWCKLVTFGNAGATAVTLGAATSGAGFPAGFFFDAEVTGAAAATITSPSTINGSASPLAIATNLGCRFTSDGANHWAVSACPAVAPSGGGGGSYTELCKVVLTSTAVSSISFVGGFGGCPSFSSYNVIDIVAVSLGEQGGVASPLYINICGPGCARFDTTSGHYITSGGVLYSSYISQTASSDSGFNIAAPSTTSGAASINFTYRLSNLLTTGVSAGFGVSGSLLQESFTNNNGFAGQFFDVRLSSEYIAGTAVPVAGFEITSPGDTLSCDGLGTCEIAIYGLTM